jgi:hypothetical protein
MSHIPIGIVTTESRVEKYRETVDNLTRNSTKAVPILEYCDVRPGLYWNHRAAWFDLFKRGDRALLLQDDVKAPADWLETVHLFARKFPKAPVISFFAFYFNHKKGIRSGYHTEYGLCEQALLIRKDFYEYRTRYIERERGLDEYKIGKRPGDYHHDVTIKDACLHARTPIIYTSPTLFQHTGDDSTVGNMKTWRGKPRISHNYIGDEANSYDYFDQTLNQPR